MKHFTPAKPGVFLTLHMLRTHVPGNLNRDDLGDPKTCIFGGARRLRISSQCQKRSIRTGEIFAKFAQETAEIFQADRLIRTRSLMDESHKIFIEEGLSEEVAASAARVLARSMRKAVVETAATKSKAKKSKDKATPAEEGEIIAPEVDVEEETQLAAISHAEIRAIADFIKRAFATNTAEDIDKKLQKAIKDAYSAKDPDKLMRLVGRNTPEISLFGRMMANDDIFKSVESPLQVAHAFTTTAVEMDRDYWTGVDDLNAANGKSGAGMIEVRKFGAGVFYSFANLNVRGLFENLVDAFPFHTVSQVRDLTLRLIMALVDAFAMEQPSGYQTSFASLAAADVLAFGLGEGQPVSAGAAFEPRLKAGGEEGEGTLEASDRALQAWVENKRQRFGQRLVLPEFGAQDLAYDDQLAALGQRLIPVLESFDR
jgi:CRISPR system Cascade subunit CasC